MLVGLGQCQLIAIRAVILSPCFQRLLMHWCFHLKRKQGITPLCPEQVVCHGASQERIRAAHRPFGYLSLERPRARAQAMGLISTWYIPLPF